MAKNYSNANNSDKNAQSKNGALVLMKTIGTLMALSKKDQSKR